MTVGIKASLTGVVACMLLTLCLAEAAPLGKDTHEVVNGTPVVGYAATGALQQALPEELPRMICTGTLVGCDTVVTAAHCVCIADSGDDCASLRPTAELSVFFQHAGVFQVSSIATHPDFDFPKNDIAVLRLSTPVSGIRPAPLLDANPAVDTELTIVGFGITEKGKSDYGLLREGLLQRESCDNHSDEVMLCFDGEESPSVSCSGDSGGPNYIEIDGVHHVAGVVSGGSLSSCTLGQKFTTLVPAFLGFIAQEGGELGTTRCGAPFGVDDPSSTVRAGEGDESYSYYEVEVPPGTAELRVGANALLGSYLRLGLAYEETPDYLIHDCGGEGRMSSFCSVMSPQAGTYQVVVSSDTAHQVAMTTLAGGPEAVTDSYQASAGLELSVETFEGLLANDLAVLDLVLSAEAVTAPSHGELELHEDGSFRYLANEDFTGRDSFRYKVIEGPYSAESEVVIEVEEAPIAGCGCQSGSQKGNWGGLALALLALFGLTPRRRRKSPLAGLR